VFVEDFMHGQASAPFRQPSFVIPGTRWCDQSGVEFSAKRAANLMPFSSQEGWRTLHNHMFAGDNFTGKGFLAMYLIRHGKHLRMG
jgi:hypothetical protein